jgi:hypothetical protein
LRIGIDFDNTLVSYDHLFHSTAMQWGLLPGGTGDSKRDVRDAVRCLDDGEQKWMQLQAQVYGPRMQEACLTDGAGEFLRACRSRGVEISVVSHKTRIAAADPNGIDLHRASLTWMEAQGFFAADGFNLSYRQVFFEPTRQAKCGRIAALDCSHFVDDLEEVFREPGFPPGIERLLLHLGSGPLPQGPFRAFPNWHAIHDAIFPSG